MAKKTNLKAPELRRLRYLAMVEQRIRGVSMADVAKNFNLAPLAVHKALTWGKRAGIIVEAEDDLLSRLYPLAAKAVGEMITVGSDHFDPATVRLVFGMVVKGRDAKVHDKSGTDEDELATVISNIRKRAQELEDTTDGTLLSSPQLSDGGQPDGAGSVQEPLPSAPESRSDPFGLLTGGFDAPEAPETAPSAVDGENGPN